MEGQEGNQWLREERERRHQLSHPFPPGDNEGTGGEAARSKEKEELEVGESEHVGTNGKETVSEVVVVVYGGEGGNKRRNGGEGRRKTERLEVNELVKGRNISNKMKREGGERKGMEEASEGERECNEGRCEGMGRDGIQRVSEEERDERENKNNIESDGRREMERSVKGTRRKGWGSGDLLQRKLRVGMGDWERRGEETDAERRGGEGDRGGMKEDEGKEWREGEGERIGNCEVEEREGRRGEGLLEERREEEGSERRNENRESKLRQEKGKRERKRRKNNVREREETVKSTITDIQKERENEEQILTKQQQKHQMPREEGKGVKEDGNEKEGEIMKGKEEWKQQGAERAKTNRQEGEATEGVEGEEKEKVSMWLGLTQEEIQLATRPKMAAWMASHCPTESRREDLVAQLSHHIPVTTVGRCGTQRCGRNHFDHHCYIWLAATHLFYLSLENAICQDYVTEKLWRPLQFGLVPVVYGGGRYTQILPPGSYIDVTDFPTVGHLADHLLHLAAHPAQYARYLLWRRYWRVVWPTPWCELCAALYRPSPPRPTTADRWWKDTARCSSLPSVVTA